MKYPFFRVIKPSAPTPVISAEVIEEPNLTRNEESETPKEEIINTVEELPKVEEIIYTVELPKVEEIPKEKIYKVKIKSK